MTKHGFAEKYPAHGYAVDTSNQLALVPGFHGMRQAHAMQFTIRSYHGCRNPCAIWLASAWPRAGLDDAGKGRIQRYSIGVFSEYFLQAARDVQAFRE